MELRFLKGSGGGEFKLQYREGVHHPQGSEWVTVPTIEDKPKKKSLEEKFQVVLSGYASRLDEVSYCRYTNQMIQEVGLREEEALKMLAEIAKDHFTIKSS